MENLLHELFTIGVDTEISVIQGDFKVSFMLNNKKVISSVSDSIENAIAKNIKQLLTRTHSDDKLSVL